MARSTLTIPMEHKEAWEDSVRRTFDDGVLEAARAHGRPSSSDRALLETSNALAIIGLKRASVHPELPAFQVRSLAYGIATAVLCHAPAPRKRKRKKAGH